MKIKWKISLIAISMVLALSAVYVIYYSSSTKTLMHNKTTVELEQYSDLGFELLDTMYPGEWAIQDGQLIKGDVVLNDNNEVVDRVTGDTVILATIFQGDTRIATTVSDETGKRMTGTQASDAVVQTVLKNGEVFEGEANILGKDAFTNYAPIKDANGNVIGMWFVGIYTNIEDMARVKALREIIIISVIVFVIAMVLSYLSGNGIAKGIGKMKESITKMEEGEFSSEFDERVLKMKDEVGEIARSSYNMQTKIAGIIKDIQEESELVKNNSINSEKDIANMHLQIEDVSATTEELDSVILL